MRERSLVAFTVLGQAAVGLLTALVAVRWVVAVPEAWARVAGTGSGVAGAGRAAVVDGWLLAPLLAVGVLLAAASAAAVLHLGSPRNAWRALTGLGSSWLSREILLAVAFGVTWLLATVLIAAGAGSAGLRAWVLTVAVLPGLGLVYAMARVYRLRTVPVWDTVLTPTGFFLTTAVLGSLGAALALALAGPGWEPAIRGLAWVAMAGLMAELALLPLVRGQVAAGRRAADPGLWRDLPGRWATVGRAALLGAALVASAGALFMATVGAGTVGMTLVPPSLAAALVASAAGEVVGRAAFYAGYARVGM
ncbi:MAG: DmsC/YnfH family molybdoenzyme membrane anchor subunit [Longimicrobiales bacterium]